MFSMLCLSSIVDEALWNVMLCMIVPLRFLFIGKERIMKSLIRLRMSAHDAHYGGNLVDGARILGLFGDVATELLVMHDGDEGLFCAYDSVEFLAPVYAGDYIEATGEILAVGNSSRKMTFEARKVIAPRPDIGETACEVLNEPVVVCRAEGTCVVPLDKQRKKQQGNVEYV